MKLFLELSVLLTLALVGAKSQGSVLLNEVTEDTHVTNLPVGTKLILREEIKLGSGSRTMKIAVNITDDCSAATIYTIVKARRKGVIFPAGLTFEITGSGARDSIFPEESETFINTKTAAGDNYEFVVYCSYRKTDPVKGERSLSSHNVSVSQLRPYFDIQLANPTP